MDSATLSDAFIYIIVFTRCTCIFCCAFQQPSGSSSLGSLVAYTLWFAWLHTFVWLPLVATHICTPYRVYGWISLSCRTRLRTRTYRWMRTTRAATARAFSRLVPPLVADWIATLLPHAVYAFATRLPHTRLYILRVHIFAFSLCCLFFCYTFTFVLILRCSLHFCYTLISRSTVFVLSPPPCLSLGGNLL